jgi:hypothetical protein
VDHQYCGICYSLRSDAYVVVAAKISTFLAFVIMAKQSENTAVNAAMMPSLPPMLSTKYSATIEDIGNNEEIIVPKRSRAQAILESE